MEKLPDKLDFNKKIIIWGIKFAGYIVLFTFLILGTVLGFLLADFIKFPDFFKGLDKITAVLCGSVLGCLIGAAFMCGANILAEHYITSKKEEIS